MTGPIRQAVSYIKTKVIRSREANVSSNMSEAFQPLEPLLSPYTISI